MRLRARIGNGNEWQTDDPSSTAASPKYVTEEYATNVLLAHGIAEVIQEAPAEPPTEPPPAERDLSTLPAKKRTYKRADMRPER